MSDLSKQAESRFLLDTVQYNAPEEWADIQIEADFEGNKNEPQITADNYTFNGASREAILKWIEDGKTGAGPGIFEGQPFQQVIFNNGTFTQSFKALIDFTRGFRNLVDDGRADVNMIKDNGVLQFIDLIGVETFESLERKGFVSSADYVTVDYVVEKKFNMFEILMSSVVLYLMIKELAEAIQKTADLIVEIAGVTASSFTGFVGALIIAIGKALIQITYTALLLIAVIDLATNLINTLVPPKRKHKAIKLKRALEVICERFGYTLDAPIPELDFVVYLPSNPRSDEKGPLGFIKKTIGTPVGIPNVLDLGYNCPEMFELALSLFDGILDVNENTVILRPEIDPFWFQQSTWSISDKDPLIRVEEFNTSDLIGNKLLTFETDFDDEWTIDEPFGRAVEVRTDPIQVVRERAVLIKGNEETNFGVALGVRKDELNAIEKFLKKVAGAVDTITGVFGGGTNFVQKIKSKIGVLKQSTNHHSVPKLLYLSGGKMPVNHRTLWSARILYDNYHKEKSFVQDNFRGQKKIYNNVRIGFGFEDYEQLLSNPYFDFNGSVAKIIKFVWITGEDEATIDFWVRQISTINLSETIIEPT